MEWTAEAKAALQQVPFFVRKRVRARVEKEAPLFDRSPSGTTIAFRINHFS